MISNSIFQNIQSAKFKDIQLNPPHDRQVLCCDINNKICVTGSADHGLRVYNTSDGQFQKELFSKKYGHQEWVTSVQILSDGRILSAGMEGFLCLWANGGVRCDFLKGHETSITKVLTDDHNVAISASYDYTLRIWAIDRIKKNQQNASGIMVGPHKGPILDFDWKNSLCVSGDRNGVVAYWDINKTDIVKKNNSHNGGVNKICILENINEKVVATAGLKDGTLKLYDLRQDKMIFKQQLHGGSISNVALNDDNLLVTGGADKNVCFLDFRNLNKQERRVQVSEGVMDLKLVKNIVMCGLRDGNLVALDSNTFKAAYGFGAMQQGAVVKMEFSEDYSNLIVCGDDPTSLLLKFNQIYIMETNLLANQKFQGQLKGLIAQHFLQNLDKHQQIQIQGQEDDYITLNFVMQFLDQNQLQFISAFLKAQFQFDNMFQCKEKLLQFQQLLNLYNKDKLHNIQKLIQFFRDKVNKSQIDRSVQTDYEKFQNENRLESIKDTLLKNAQIQIEQLDVNKKYVYLQQENKKLKLIINEFERFNKDDISLQNIHKEATQKFQNYITYLKEQHQTQIQQTKKEYQKQLNFQQSLVNKKMSLKEQNYLNIQQQLVDVKNQFNNQEVSHKTQLRQNQLQFDQQLKNVQTQMQYLQQEKNKLNEQIYQLQNRYNELLSETQENQKRTSLFVLNNEIQNLKNQNSKLEKLCNNNQASSKQFFDLKEILEQENLHVKNQNSNLNTQIKDVQQHIKFLQQQIDEKNTFILHQTQKIQNFQNQHQQSLAKLQQNETQIEKQQKEIQKLIQKNLIFETEYQNQQKAQNDQIQNIIQQIDQNENISQNKMQKILQKMQILKKQRKTLQIIQIEKQFKNNNIIWFNRTKKNSKLFIINCPKV